jgi:predicted DNA-binding transcriptional regulator AlpA
MDQMLAEAPADAEVHDWISPTKAAAAAGITTRTLQNLERRGDGPPVYRFSQRIVRYKESEVLDWIRSRRS